jgi:hypothetical protein
MTVDVNYTWVVLAQPKRRTTMLRLTVLLIALVFAATSVHPVFAQLKSGPAAKSDKAAAAKKEPLDINTAQRTN